MTEHRPMEDFSTLDAIAPKETGQRIKCLVQHHGLSQRQLAALLGKDIKTISNYYCGKSLPDKQYLLLLARILGKSIEDLLVFRGDVEGYQRMERYHLEYDDATETLSDAIQRAQTHSKLFHEWSQGYAHIRNLKEAGLCLSFLSDSAQQYIRKLMMDELLSGYGTHSPYMKQIYEDYIWPRLTDEQKAFCEKTFASWREGNEELPSLAKYFELKQSDEQED